MLLKDQFLLRRPREKRKQACPRDNKGIIEKVGRRKELANLKMVVYLVFINE